MSVESKREREEVAGLGAGGPCERGLINRHAPRAESRLASLPRDSGALPPPRRPTRAFAGSDVTACAPADQVALLILLLYLHIRRGVHGI